jgi:hypothetical protein
MFWNILHGSVNVWTTEVQLLADLPAWLNSVLVQVFPASGNSGIVYLGNTGLTASTSNATKLTNWVPITASSNPVTIFVSDPRTLYVRADGANQTVAYLVTKF